MSASPHRERDIAKERALTSSSPTLYPVADEGSRCVFVWPSSWIKVPEKAGSVLIASLLSRAQRSFSVVPTALFRDHNRPYKQAGLIVIENKGLSF